MKKSGAIGGSDKEKREDFFPSDIDIIPAFSRVTVKLACKGWDKYVEGDLDANGDEVTKSDLSPCYRGYGFGIVEVRMAAGSACSEKNCLMSVVPDSPEEMRRIQTAFCESNWAIRQNFQCENVPFMITDPSRSAYCCYDTETECFKIMQWNSSGDCIDIQRDVMLKACNAVDNESAWALIDVSLAMSSIKFICFVNEYKARDKIHSRFTGYPIIDTSKIMKAVNVKQLPNNTPFKTEHFLDTDSEKDPIQILVSATHTSVTGSNMVSCAHNAQINTRLHFTA